MPELEKGDQVRFEYRGSNYTPGVYEGHVVGLGPKRIVIKSGKDKAYIHDSSQIIGIVQKNEEDKLEGVSEEFRFAHGLDQEPIRELED